MDIIQVITTELGVRRGQVEAAVQLIDEGCTIPFIARYRKEVTGSLNDEQLRTLHERLTYLRGLEDKKAQAIDSIREQGLLTPELQQAIEAAQTLVVVEDLYRPYRPKRRTRATIAKERGLEPLANILLLQETRRSMLEEAAAYVCADKDVASAEDALEGAKDIVAEHISDDANYRIHIRKITAQKGTIISAARDSKDAAEGKAGESSKSGKAAPGSGSTVATKMAKAAPGSDSTAATKMAKAAESSKGNTSGKTAKASILSRTPGVYEMYYAFEEPIRRIAGHRVLALNRGENEKALTVKVNAPEEEILQWLERQVITRNNPRTTPILQAVVADSYKRLIAPAIEREIRNDLTEAAEDGAIKVFGKNLEQLLMQPPIVGQYVLGWDPAFRTGCKLAVVDPTGKVLDTVVIYPTAPTNDAKIRAAKETCKRLIKQYNITLISLGNGTASRESEQIIVELLKEIPEHVQYVITNEAGASVYSASKLATEEFPEFDVGQRSAASIARRLQDPLAELVKIDPQSIGVGQYQHDMNQKRLGEALQGVVEDCVNKVGVDLNTASASLLEYVSGISKPIARNIVAYREEHGRFTSRRDLLKVPRLGPKAYEQCAGFTRITDGTNPLDATSVHPESYDAAKALLAQLGFQPENIRAGGLRGISGKISNYKALASTLGIGEPTLRDIARELERPARDPRDEMPRPILRTDVMNLEDLKEGMILKGTVRNIVDFGAFVDIGVHQDGLVHISQMCDRFIKHPLEVVSVGDIVQVRVLSVDLSRRKISLSMKGIQ